MAIYSFKFFTLFLAICFIGLYEFVIQNSTMDLERASLTISDRNQIILERALINEKNCKNILIGTSLTSTLPNTFRELDLCNFSFIGPGFFSTLKIIEKNKMIPEVLIIELNSILQEDSFLRESSVNSLDVFAIRHLHFIRKENNLFLRLINFSKQRLFPHSHIKEYSPLQKEAVLTKTLEHTMKTQQPFLHEKTNRFINTLKEARQKGIKVILVHLTPQTNNSQYNIFYHLLTKRLEENHFNTLKIKYSQENTFDGLHLISEKKASILNPLFQILHQEL